MATSRRWLFDLLVTSGMAATVTALGSYLVQLSEGGRTRQKQQCDIAAQFLQDETPTPYISRDELARVSQLAADRLKRCLKE